MIWSSGTPALKPAAWTAREPRRPDPGRSGAPAPRRAVGSAPAMTRAAAPKRRRARSAPRRGVGGSQRLPQLQQMREPDGRHPCPQVPGPSRGKPAARRRHRPTRAMAAKTGAGPSRPSSPSASVGAGAVQPRPVRCCDRGGCRAVRPPGATPQRGQVAASARSSDVTPFRELPHDLN